MSATINTRKGNIAMEYLKKTAGYVTGATGEYIKDVMPVTGSTISDAKDTLQELNSKFKTTSASIMPKLRQLKQQANFRTISNWFLQKEDEFDDFGNIDSNLDFDIDTDAPSEVVQAQITEWGKNADQISKTVVATTSKMVDAQISATANMLSAIDQQTAVISSGFDKTNSTLNKILEVVTKNTTALIETNVAKESSNDKLTRGGFNFNEYKKLVSTNMKNSEYGLMAAMIPMMMSLGKNAITPQEIIKGGLGFLVNKTAPNFKTNMAALDKAVGDAIMGSLIRLGESDNPIARMFGVDGNRKNASTQRSSLELKAVPFDTVTKEAITNAIPGYLRQILVALGGPDQIYDYRSRSFKTKAAIKREFGNLVASQGTMRSSSNNVRKSFTPDEFTDMMYDLTLNELGSMKTSDARTQLGSMDNSKNAKKFAKKLLSGVQLSSKEKGAMDRFANELSRAIDAGLGLEIMNQLGATNIARNQRGRDVINNMQNMSMDTSYLRNNAKEDRRTLLQSRGMVNDDSSVSVKNPNAMLTGTNYTNMALYEIYRRLNEGINVYQVGEAKGSARQRERYLKLEDSYLHIPLGHRPKPIRDPKVGEDRVGISGINDDGTPEPNGLQNQELEDGSTENLSRGQRFSRWGKSRGKNLLNAIFRGTPEDVTNAFGAIVKDVGEVTGDAVKKGLSKVNDQFGNISGYLKHKIFGTGYEYTGDDGKPVQVKTNEKGGIFGFIKDKVTGMFSGTKEKGSKWFSDVAKYFDYGDDPEESTSVKGKRKRILSTSVGALAGVGILGGPIGLLFGAIAGNALSFVGMGDRIKRGLFGDKDVWDEHGNKKKGKKRGLIGTLSDAVVDPIRYQVEKSVHTLGNILKKSVLGPLSDLGLAIKDRITDTASKTFGKVFSFIGNILMAPFKAAAKIAKAPITLIGNLIRGTAGAAGFASETGLGLLANMIAPKETREKIRDRKKERKEDIRNEEKNSIFRGPKSYKRWRQRKRAGGSSDIEEYIAEDTSDIASNISKFTDAATTKGSIFTHDQGIHDKLDTMIHLMGGESKPGFKSWKMKPRARPERNDIVGSSITAASTLAAGDDKIDSTEEQYTADMIREAGKENPDQNKILSKLKSLFGHKKKKKDDDSEKKSWWEKLLDGLGGALGNWKTLLAGAGIALAIFNEDVRDFTLNVLGDLGKSALNLWDWIKGKDEEKNNTVLNLATSPLDIQADSASAYFNPLENMHHVQTDAAGNRIVNNSANNVRNQILLENLKRSGFNGLLGTHMNSMGASQYEKDLNALGRARDKTIKLDDAGLGDTAKGRKAHQRYMDLGTKVAEHDPTFFDKHSSLKTLAGGLTSIGVGQGFGFLANKGITAIGNELGLDEQTVQMAARTGESVVTIVSTQHALRNKGLAGKAKKLLMSALDMLFTKIGSNNLFKAADAGLKSLQKGIETIIAKGFEKIAPKLAARLGVDSANATLGAASAGISIAVLAVGGGIWGANGVENLFSIPPKQADPLMISIATVLGAALTAIPYIGLVEIADILIVPAFGKGIRQTIAQAVYKLCGGEDKLELLQGDWADQLRAYNETYDQNLSMSTFNDMANQTAGSKFFGRGSSVINEEGKVVFDEAGAVLQTGNGMTGWVSGRQAYAKDSEGNVIFDGDKAVMAINADGSKQMAQKRDKFGNLMFDSNGNPIYESKKIGDYLGDIGRGIGNFFGGKTTYQTDDEGNVIYEDGKAVVSEKQGNVFQRAGSFISEKVDKFLDIGKFTTDVFKGVVKAAISGESQDIDISTEDPLYGIKKGIFSVANLISIPIGMIAKIGKPIFGWIKDKIITPVKGAASDIFSSVKDSFDGKIPPFTAAYWAGPEPKDDEPLSPIQAILSRLGKMLMAIPSGVGFIANKVFGGIKSFIQAAPDGIKDASKDIARVASGKAFFDADYWKSDAAESDNPLSTLSNVAGFLTRLLSAPHALVGHIASNIINQFKKFTNGVGDITLFGANLVKEAALGRVSIFTPDYWKSPTVPEDSPLGGLAVVGTYLTRIMALPSLLVTSIFNGAKNLGSNIWDAITSFFNGPAGDKINEYGALNLVENGGTGGLTRRFRTNGIGGAIDPYIEDDTSHTRIMNGAGRSWGSSNANETSRINLNSQYENGPGFIGPVRPENMTGGNPLGKPYQLNAGMDEFGHSSIMGNYPGHTGIDLASSDGNQENVPVYSRFSGIVEEVNRSNTGFGNMVSIRTNDGILIKNAHLGSIASGVQPNAEVTPGKQLGIMGSTGSSTGPHLHYEMRDLNNQVIDPYPTLTSGISGSNNTDIGSEAGYNDYGSPAGGTEEDTTNKRTGFFGLIDGLLDIANSFFSNIFGKISGNSTSTDYSNSGNSWFSFPGSNNSQSPSGSSIYDSYSPQYGTVDGPVQMLPKADMAKIGWGSGQEAEIIDMRHQGLSYKIYGNGKYSTHTDYTTVTKNDTATKLQAAGGKWTWNDGSEIPVLLKFKGKYYAAATHSFPHGRKTVQGADNGLVHHPGWSGDKDTNNGNYGGHFCLWYVDSTGNGNQDPTSARAKRYHAAVEEAYRLGIEMFGESTNTSSSISPGTLSSGTDNASRIYNFLVEKGLTPEAAAAIVGNIQAESYDNIRPDTYTIDTNGKPSGGIAQWNDDRFTKMANAVPDWKTNFDGQLQYLWDDMHGKYGWNLDNRMNHNSWEKGFREKGAVPLTGGLEEFKRMTDVEAATKLFDATYEISGGDSSSRIKNAKAFLSSIGSGTSSTYRASSSPGQQSLMYDDGGTGGSGIGRESIRIRNRGGIGGSITSPQFMSRSKNRSDASIGTSFTSKASSRSSSRTSTSKYRPDAGGIFDQDDEENVSSRDVDVRSILKFILEELKDINGNTDEANTFLDSLNKKDFGTPNTTVDSGIRNQSSRRKNTFNQQNGNNTKTIGSIVRG